jgi:hypothetical protein
MIDNREIMEYLGRLVEDYLRTTPQAETLEFAQHWVQIRATLDRLVKDQPVSAPEVLD